MDWTDRGIVLSARRHGESAVILALMTETHGRHLGIVQGGAGKRARGLYEAGNLVSAVWRARLEEHLGTFTCELVRAQAAPVLDDPLRLAGLSSLCAVVEAALPEREAHPALYARMSALIEALDAPDWTERYVGFELALLSELGFGLDPVVGEQLDDSAGPRRQTGLAESPGRHVAGFLEGLQGIIRGSEARLSGGDHG